MSEHKYKLGADGMLLFMDLSGVPPYTNYDTVVCLIEVAPKDTVNIVDASSDCGPDKQAGIISYSIGFKGIHLQDPASGKVSGSSIRVALRNTTRCGYKISPAVPQEGDEIEVGECFVAELGSTYNFNAPTDFTGTLQPYGTSHLHTYNGS